MPATMNLTINGARRAVEAGTVAEMLAALALDPRGVVVEVNREIIRRHAIESTPVADGDIVEIVHFVGGG